MKSIIEYLLLFIILTIFMPNGYLTIIYILANIVVLLPCLVLLIKHRKDVEVKKQFNIYNLLNIIFLVLLNLVVKIDLLNLIFGGIVFVYFIITSVMQIVKKDYTLSKSKFTIKYLFDIYLIFYLCSFVLFRGEF